MYNISVKRKADSVTIVSSHSIGPKMVTSFCAKSKRPRHAFETKTQELERSTDESNLEKRNKKNEVNNLDTKKYLSVEDNSAPMNQCEKPMSSDDEFRLKQQLTNLSGSSVQHVDVAPEVNPVVQHSPAPPLVSSMLKKTSKDKRCTESVAKIPSIVRGELTREACEKYYATVGPRRKPTITETFQDFREIRKAKEVARKQRALLKERKMNNRQKK